MGGLGPTMTLGGTSKSSFSLATLIIIVAEEGLILEGGWGRGSTTNMRGDGDVLVPSATLPP